MTLRRPCVLRDYYKDHAGPAGLLGGPRIRITISSAKFINIRVRFILEIYSKIPIIS